MSYQVRAGHHISITDQYLNYTKNQPSAQCRWCPYRTQMQENVFINPPPLEFAA